MTTTLTHAALSVKGLSVGYGARAFVKDVDISVSPGEIVALLGPNGAGKSTTLMGIGGVAKTFSGQVEIDGESAAGAPHLRARQGLRFITQERCVFMGMSVVENLRVGGVDPEVALARFPELREHAKRRVGLLSGGQQQMLAVARALAARPKVVLADELSLGLAPMIVDRILEALVEAAAEDGLGVLLVEQLVPKALSVADRVAVLRRGVVELEGEASNLRNRMAEIEELYL